MDGMDEFNQGFEQLPDLAEWPQNQILAFEKEVLGFYVSGHPLSHYDVEIKEFTDFTTHNLKTAVDGQDIRIVGLINYIKLTNTRKTNERMAIIRIEDMYGQIEVVVFPSAYEKLAHYIREGQVIFLKGKVGFKEDQPNIIANEMMEIHEVYDSIKAINVDVSGANKVHFDDLKGKLQSSPGKVPVYLKVDTKTNKSVQILVGEDLYVTPNEALMNEIKEIMGQENFSVTL